MLARSFMNAADLGLSEDEQEALIKTLFAFERGDVQEDHFAMYTTGRPEFWFGRQCRSPACICGWARHFSGKYDYGMLSMNEILGRPQGLRNLFRMGSTNDGAGIVNATVAQAAIALSNYLTTGEPRWNESLTLGKPVT